MLAVADEQDARARTRSSRCSSSVNDSYAARSSPIASADVTHAVGISPDVVKS